MTLDRGLAIAGLIIGIPGLFVLFEDQNIVLGLALISVSALLFGSWAIVYYLSNLPPFSVVKQDVILKFRNGRKYAHLTRKFVFKANHRHQKIISFRNNSTDGTFSNVYWNGDKIKANQIRREAGDLRLDIPLRTAPQLFSTFSGELEMRYADSFEEQTECVVYKPDFRTKKVNVIINLPRDFPCTDATVYRIGDAGEVKIGTPTITKNNHKLEYTIQKPKIGVEYKIEWTW